MRLAATGKERIAAPVATVWSRLLDHHFIARCAPGIESVHAEDATHFRAVTALGVGSVKVRFTVHVELVDLRPPESARMLVRGEAPGSALNAASSATLSANDDGSTSLDWAVTSDVHGTLANVGARLLNGTARRLMAAFWKKFAARVAGAPAEKGKKQRSHRTSRT